MHVTHISGKIAKEIAISLALKVVLSEDLYTKITWMHDFDEILSGQRLFLNLFMFMHK